MQSFFSGNENKNLQPSLIEATTHKIVFFFGIVFRSTCFLGFSKSHFLESETQAIERFVCTQNQSFQTVYVGVGITHDGMINGFTSDVSLSRKGL